MEAAERDRKRAAKAEHDGGRGVPNASASNCVSYEGRCDVCQHLDGFRGNTLQRCRECHVLVHEQCYGKVATGGKDADFTCHACAAVGTEVKVNVPSRVGGSSCTQPKNAHIAQTERPTECVLCNHHEGVHAMHPLLDTHGPDGQQLVLPAKGDGTKRKEKRLAWVHTLCASVICSYPQVAGCVYGCFEDKSYEDDGSEEEDDEEEAEFDGESKSHSAVKSESDEADGISEMSSEKSAVKELRYYAIAAKDNGESTAWSKRIEDNRANLRCIICGEQRGLQIPLQCIAGEENERQDFLACHPNLYDKAGTECGVAMHVGCARWGYKEATEGAHLARLNGIPCQLCYFWPNKLDQHDEGEEEGEEGDAPVPHCYCSAHAREVVENHPEFKRLAAKAAAVSKPPAQSSRAIKREVKRGEDVARGSSRGANMGARERSPERRPRAIISRTAEGAGGRERRAVSPQRTEPNPRTRQASPVRSGRLFTLKPRKSKLARHEPSLGAARSPKRKKKEGVAEASAPHFPVRGRAASALARSPPSAAGRKKPPPPPGLPPMKTGER
ncbi:hypothetical protein ACHAXT_004243 [Thalassiosira profunda]